MSKKKDKIELRGQHGQLPNDKKTGIYGYRGLPLTIEYFDDQTNYLLGRLKTIIDACIADKQQNKALKDLVSIEVWGRRNYIVGECGDASTIINDGTTDIV